MRGAMLKTLRFAGKIPPKSPFLVLILLVKMVLLPQ
jgi:hypothetical protein